MDEVAILTDPTPKNPPDAIRPEPEWVGRFLEHFRKCGVVAWAAELTGISRPYVYQYKDAHPDFARRFDEAADESIEWIEAAAVKGAVEDKNPTLIIFLLKTRKRAVYGEAPRVIVSGDAANPVKHEHSGTVEQKHTIDRLAERFAAVIDRAAEEGVEADPAGRNDPPQPVDSGPV